MKRKTAVTIIIVILLLLAVLILLAYLQPSKQSPPLGTLTAYFLDVGQGDSALIVFPNGKRLLIDGGKDPSTLSQHLALLNITFLDEVVATHPDADHIGGLVGIIADYGVGEYISNCDQCTTKLCESLQQELQQKKVLQTCVGEHDRLEIQEGIAVDILNPQDTFLKGDNDNSVVLRLAYGQFSMLLTGDCETACERELMSGRLQSDVLKVGHHGSRSSSSPQFLDEVQPDLAIISVGRNSFGHPDSYVLQRLAAMGTEVWRTDIAGSMILMTDGMTFNISAWP